ncbi:hypothetical protein Sjap_010389 [Stephania japonica]|uniref:Uncharacterized protein n=1 Tax=Stephania japonica TaxID=461633 RepID=A0AAP0JBI9_9MAGN
MVREEGDLELLMPANGGVDEDRVSKSPLPSSPSHSGKQVALICLSSSIYRCSCVLIERFVQIGVMMLEYCFASLDLILIKISNGIKSWASKKFMTGCVILLPITITVYITWWFIHFVDGFFSPVYVHLLGINAFGLGFITSIPFICLIGVFMSSWLGASLLQLGEWFIKKMPLVSYIYSASKQISAAISPDKDSNAFKEVAIIRHPRVGEYAFGFITSSVILQTSMGDEELCCVYVPSNNLYIGDVYLVNSKDVLRPNLSVQDAIGGMSIPQILVTAKPHTVVAASVGRIRSMNLNKSIGFMFDLSFRGHCKSSVVIRGRS